MKRRVILISVVLIALFAIYMNCQEERLERRESDCGCQLENYKAPILARPIPRTRSYVPLERYDTPSNTRANVYDNWKA